MDFAENCLCQSLEEVQSAYCNGIMVTLHPVVVYYKGEDQDVILHRSFVFVSDELSHKSVAVYAILKKLIPRSNQKYKG